MKRFFKWVENRSEEKEIRTTFGTLAGKVGLLSNLLLFVMKLMIGLFSGSVSIIADAMNNLSDSASSVLTLIGFRIAAKPADKKHPYGHQRSEYITGMIISFIILFVGGQFLITSIKRILQPESLQTSSVMFVILILSIGIKVAQGYFYQETARHIKSKTLLASAKDSFNDVYTTLTVFVSAGIEHFTGWQIDGYTGVIIAIFILFSGAQMISGFINVLLGDRPNEEELKLITDHLDNQQLIIGYHDLLIHNYGPEKKFATVHIEIDDRWNLNRSHKVLTGIEKEFKNKLKINLVCHLDPIAVRSKEQQKVYKLVKELLNSYELNLQLHDFRLENKDDLPLIQFDVVVPENISLTNEQLLIGIEKDINQKIGSYAIELVFDRTYLLKK
ncbi:cation diffusion facilitator family transporter [Carnobacterium alterfunditum]|uniref:Cation diffusion facilitator family transporter n=1 Tax=Carnobacterium alterfunditum TaxID=28230 RepID=A0A1N6F0A4_9LACT|nr:cation diffusion facilitator family transporter [Carnobacterium alterfunditum]SIN88669.1 cation diffusion facilitator family transporter [Carnobacterium alterfunditum]